MNLKEGDVICQLMPLKNERVALLQEEQYEVVVTEGSIDFQLTQLFKELPLPHQQEEVKLEDYTTEEETIAAKEIEQYITSEGENRYINLHQGIKILAGDKSVTDTRLVLLAKTLSTVSAKVWYDTNSTELFPGIPETDVAIQIPLRTAVPIKHKVRRLNEKCYKQAQLQLKKEEAFGLIGEASSEYGFPILCVAKKNGKLRICGDYMTLSECAIPD